MTYQKFIDAIQKTGYGLEYKISSILSSNGWSTINNKYYIDDVQGVAREIDVLAYKVHIEKGIQIYTVLIISCKKSEENTWALLAKSRNDKDPNIDWKPITVWSNHRILKLILENYDWKSKYISDFSETKRSILIPEKHIFAFQEINNKKGTPQNDTNIFNSIVSAMKSQDYEISSLNKRKGEKSIYYFNLLTVVDAPLIRVNFNSSSIEVEEIESDLYVGNYIVNRKEQTSKVHFVKSGSFEANILNYNNLHSHNILQTIDIYESFYPDSVQDEKKLKLFSDDLQKQLRIYFYYSMKKIRVENTVPLLDTKISVRWIDEKRALGIAMLGVWKDEEVNHLQNDEELKLKITKALKNIYRYEGKFLIECDVPF